MNQTFVYELYYCFEILQIHLFYLLVYLYNKQSLSEYSELLASFDKFEKVKSKAEQQMEQKPLSRIENEAEVVGNVTNVETFTWEYMKGNGNGIDDVRFDLEDEEKLTKVLDVLCDVTALSEELPDIAKTARKLDWTKDGLIELKVSDV